MIAKTRRVVTGCNATGKSTVIFDGVPSSHFELPDNPGMGGYLVWLTDQTPASNEGNSDAAARPFPAYTLPKGTNFHVFQFPPLPDVKAMTADERARVLGAGHGPEESEARKRHPGMHITQTTDYIIMISGEITLVLEDGEVTLYPGDTLVDRGVYHAWENRGAKPAIFASITIDAKPPDGVTNAGY